MMKGNAFLVVTVLLGTLGVSATGTSAEPKLVPVAAAAGDIVHLSPKNTSIEFIGIHEGPKPDPRKGGFGAFSGQAKVDSSGALRSITFELDTASLWTEIEKLTAHLKSPDFFDVRTYPKASFASTSVAPADEDGTATVTGNFTLLGKTQSIKLPVTARMTADGLTLVSEFNFDRTEFGMDYGQGKIANQVVLKVTIGKPTPVAGS